MTLKKIYFFLLEPYGPQGWWPLLECEGGNPTKTGAMNGYHPGDYSYPKTDEQRFEICVGAILTQNTSWVQVEKALQNLKQLRALRPEAMLKLELRKLKQAIKPAGYFNQKARKIKLFTAFYQKLNGKIPRREELLNVWGIGPETADSIQLYAYRQPSFVIDAYTKRIFSRIGICRENVKYEELQALFEKELKPDPHLYSEYHALIVEHAKRYCRKKPLCKECPLLSVCSFGQHKSSIRLL